MKSPFRSDLLEGKVAFVTGGGSGICKTITEGYLRHGARAVIMGRKADRLEAAAKELTEATGNECLAAAGDVRIIEDVERCVQTAIDRFGRLDLVVNGAAGNFLAPAAALSPKGFRTVMEIDTIGTYNVCRTAFDKYLRDHGGQILNVSATLHYAATPMQVHASAAKAGIDAITRTLALEWGPIGIRVNGVAPGPIDDTEGMTRLAGAMRDKVIEGVPMKRLGTTWDIAYAALYLASDVASYVHGETLVVDGGAWLPGMGHMMGG
jgi:peroxisomal 2,4-dienoyl-CoA reductase